MKPPSLDDIVTAYSRFVPHQFLNLLKKKNVTDVVLGESLEKRMTILFSDMRNFTAISESMPPRENFQFINAYLEQMEPVISHYHGFIDKYIGDAIMAIFPTSADDAVGGAIAMLGKLAGYNSRRLKDGDNPIGIGIGLNTGLMMLGTVGGANRMQGTVIGDAVNLASRVEHMTRDYGAGLLITEHTYNSIPDASKYKIRFADRVRARGRERPQSVYEVFDADPPYLRDAKDRTLRTFERAVAHYYFKDIAHARSLFSQCVEECPDDTLAKVYLGKCDRFLETGIHEGTGEIDLVVEWTPDISVGYSEIDEQHRELFAAVQKFVEKVKHYRDFSHVGPLLAFLDNYIRVHFDHEEMIMERFGYPFLDVEKEQHEAFSWQFAKLKNEISDSIDIHFLLFKIQVLVIDWLVHHTGKLDKHFGKFLRLNGGRF